MLNGPSPWYQAFFTSDYLKLYEERFDPLKNAREVDFVEQALDLPRGAAILDLCCGQGRHALLLAERGYHVTGLDLSREYLAIGLEGARKTGMPIELVQGDMRSLPFANAYDAVIDMFTAFGYLETDEEDARVLLAIAQSLKPGGKLLLDMLNREWVIVNQVQKDWHIGPDGSAYLENRELDLLTSRNHVTFHSVSKDGGLKELGGHHIRLYTLAEMAAMLGRAGLELTDTYGDYDGSPYGVASRRMIVLAQKTAHG